MQVESTSGRAVISDESGKIRVLIPSKFSFVVIFLLFWLGCWAFGEVMVIRKIFFENTPGPADIFMIFWLGGWTFGGGFVFYSILWIFMGQEVVQADSVFFIVGKSLGSFNRSKKYAVSEMTNLRVDMSSSRPWGYYSNNSLFGGRNGVIVFDYGDRTIRFGMGLEEAEAAKIVNYLKDRLRIKDKAASSIS